MAKNIGILRNIVLYATKVTEGENNAFSQSICMLKQYGFC